MNRLTELTQKACFFVIPRSTPPDEGEARDRRRVRLQAVNRALMSKRTLKSTRETGLSRRNNSFTFVSSVQTKHLARRLRVVSFRKAYSPLMEISPSSSEAFGRA